MPNLPYKCDLSWAGNDSFILIKLLRSLKNIYSGVFSSILLEVIKKRIHQLKESKNLDISKRLQERESIIIENIQILNMYLQHHISNKPFNSDIVKSNNIKDYKYLSPNKRVNIRRIIIKFLVYQLYKVINNNVLSKEETIKLDFMLNTITNGIKNSLSVASDEQALAMGKAKSMKEEKSQGARSLG